MDHLKQDSPYRVEQHTVQEVSITCICHSSLSSWGTISPKSVTFANRELQSFSNQLMAVITTFSTETFNSWNNQQVMKGVKADMSCFIMRITQLLLIYCVNGGGKEFSQKVCAFVTLQFRQQKFAFLPKYFLDFVKNITSNNLKDKLFNFGKDYGENLVRVSVLENVVPNDMETLVLSYEQSSFSIVIRRPNSSKSERFTDVDTPIEVDTATVELRAEVDVIDENIEDENVTEDLRSIEDDIDSNLYDHENEEVSEEDLEIFDDDEVDIESDTSTDMILDEMHVDESDDGPSEDSTNEYSEIHAVEAEVVQNDKIAEELTIEEKCDENRDGDGEEHKVDLNVCGEEDQQALQSENFIDVESLVRSTSMSPINTTSNNNVIEALESQNFIDTIHHSDNDEGEDDDDDGEMITDILPIEAKVAQNIVNAQLVATDESLICVVGVKKEPTD